MSRRQSRASHPSMTTVRTPTSNGTVSENSNGAAW
jgi:hypothetical protein